MIGFEIFFILLVVGLVSNYLLALRYLKGLRGEVTLIKDINLILCSIVWGTPIIIFMYLIFNEIRMEDKANKYRLIISEVIILVLHVVLIFLLFYFKVINLDELNTSN